MQRSNKTLQAYIQQNRLRVSAGGGGPLYPGREARDAGCPGTDAATLGVQGFLRYHTSERYRMLAVLGGNECQLTSYG